MTQNESRNEVSNGPAPNFLRPHRVMGRDGTTSARQSDLMAIDSARLTVTSTDGLD